MGLGDSDAFMPLEEQLSMIIKQMFEWRRRYEAQKAITKHTALWLEGYRRLAHEKGIHDFNRLLDILAEIEAEGET